MNKEYQAIYTFYDVDGYVSEDVIYYLAELKKIIKNILVVVNGKINAQSRQKLKCLDVGILVRPNVGMDFGAWKSGILSIGWDKIYKLDGLLLCNCTCFGPIFPFNEMFNEMAKKECDFWGINRHPELDINLVDNDPNSKVFEHIQSYFIFFKSTILKDNHFKNWWDTLEQYSEYNKEVGYHETKFTKYFEDAGFVSSTYMDFKKYKNLICDNASIKCPEIQLIEDRNPLIKKKVFSENYNNFFYQTAGFQALRAIDFIKNHTEYDVNYIYNWMIKNVKLSTIRRNLHLNWILPTNLKYKISLTNSVCAIFFVYYNDLQEYCIRYMLSLPAGSLIVFVSADESLLEDYKTRVKNFSNYTFDFRKSKPIGRDVSAYLVCCSDLFNKFDYICCVHDKKSKFWGSLLTGYHYSEHCFMSCLYNDNYVNNIIATFESNPKLGMLVPPILNFSLSFSHLLGAEMYQEENNVKNVLSMLDINVPFDNESVIPFGTMFWVRGKAFLPMFNYKWDYDDFPKEPIACGCTILHAIERAYAFAIQSGGYVVGMAAPDKYASVFIDNQLYMLRELNNKLFSAFGVMNFHSLLSRISSINTINVKEHKTLTQRLRNKIKKIARKIK